MFEGSAVGGFGTGKVISINIINILLMSLRPNIHLSCHLNVDSKLRSDSRLRSSYSLGS